MDSEIRVRLTQLCKARWFADSEIGARLRLVLGSFAEPAGLRLAKFGLDLRSCWEACWFADSEIRVRLTLMLGSFTEPVGLRTAKFGSD